MTWGLQSFCTIKTKRLFSIVGLPQTFHAMDPFECDEEDTFQGHCASSTGWQSVMTGLSDSKRGVALIQEFNKKLTAREKQLQFLLQVVSDHRPKFLDCSKKTDGNMCNRMRVLVISHKF